MGWLENLDFAIFHLINSRWSNPLFDLILPLFREKWFWAPLYLFILAFVWMQWGARRALWFAIVGALTVGAADFTSSAIIKKNVQRLRPCNDAEIRESVILRVSCGSGYSFTSSHAANHFAFAAFVGTGLRRRLPSLRRWLLLWAALVAYAQVYVGVHYPLDVLAGALLGALIGYAGAFVFLRRALHQ